MKIIIAPNALKESLSAPAAAKAIEQGIHAIIPDAYCVSMPIADGGDGLLQVLKSTLKGKLITVPVAGPLGKTIDAVFLYCPEKSLAVIELASAAGLALLKESQRNVRQASTYGVGQMIKSALALDVDHIVLGIGGSASNDAAMGIASALGMVFYDGQGEVLAPCGESLIRVDKIDSSRLEPRMRSIRFDVICDVENPMFGLHGAAHVYAAQKGANDEDIEFLDKGLQHFSRVLKNTYACDVSELPGGGAAGGVGAGLKAMFNADLRKGAKLVLELIGIEKALKGADLLITTEGRFDSQTLFGKAPIEVARLAKSYEIPVVLIAGQVDENCLTDIPEIDQVYSLVSEKNGIRYAMENAEILIKEAIQSILKKL